MSPVPWLSVIIVGHRLDLNHTDWILGRCWTCPGCVHGWLLLPSRFLFQLLFFVDGGGAGHGAGCGDSGAGVASCVAGGSGRRTGSESWLLWMLLFSSGYHCLCHSCCRYRFVVLLLVVVVVVIVLLLLPHADPTLPNACRYAKGQNCAETKLPMGNRAGSPAREKQRFDIDYPAQMQFD